MTKPVWGALGLAAGAFVLYAAFWPQPMGAPRIDLDGDPPSIRRFGEGDVVSTEIASTAPRGATVSFSPEGEEVYVPPRDKERDFLRKRMDLPEPDRARFQKRIKDPMAERELQYRFRVEKGWEIYRVPEAIRESYLDTAAAMAVAQTAGGQTAVAGSGREGFEITHIDAGSLLAEAGLLEGDIIISVNGHPVRTEDDGQRLYARLKHEDTFLVVVERDGDLVNLYYELEKETK